VDERENEWAFQKALMLTLANTAYEALLVLNRDFEIIAINNTAEELFGRKRPIGETLISVTHSPELESVVLRALEYHEESFEEQILLQKHHYRVRAQVIQREGHEFIGLALEDVSDLVRLNRARRDMVANISHELRTPVANIRSIIDSLFHEDENPKRKRSISSLQAIARETDSLLWVIQEMMDLSMIESGQAIVRMVKVNLRDLVQDAVERIEDQADDKEIKVAYDIPKKLLVWCDWDQIRRVLVNLIHNAVKWSPRGSKIHIGTSLTPDEVTIEVTDEGPGVPDDQVERIFERFYQIDSSRSGHEGTGLGLAICKHIVEAHDCRIWAEGKSQAKHGKFLFTLACVENETEPPHA
jgi:two-component system, OmpR family, phosphate regulon sensor histidine kinase PhoR